MPYCHNREFIFIHIPKTGGTSIEYKLNLGHIENGFEIKDNIAYQHSDCNYYKSLFGEEKFNKYLKFTIVRNPYTRIISDFFYLPLENVGFKGNQTFDDFLEYIEVVIKNNNFNENLYSNHFKPQYMYICDNNYSIKVDKLFYFEKYHEIDEFLLKNFDITDQNIYLKGNYKKNDIILTDIQKEKVYKLYKKDFDIFGYDK
jgi:hypothetical protein